MSIIYKALQKTQQNLVSHNQATLNRRLHWLDVGIICLITVLVTVLIIAYYPKIKTYVSSFHREKPAAVVSRVPAVLPEVEYQGDIILSGVFVSDTERVAMINNQQLHIGDNIRGMKLVSIDQDKIKLQGEHAIYIIHTAL